MLALAFLSNFGQFGARLIVSPLVPTLVDEFAVTKSEFGLVLTGMWAAFALWQYPSGVLADRYGERRVAVLALALTGGCSVLLSFADSFLLFGLLALALGAGAGLYFSVGTALLSTLYDDTGTAFSVHSAGAPIAGLLVPPATVALATRYGWPTAFRVGGVVALGIASAFAWRVRPTPPARPEGPLGDRFDPAIARRLLGPPDVLFTLALATAGMYVFQSFASFFPTFLVEYHGLSEATASTAFGATFVVSALTLPVAGRASDRLGRDPAMAGAFTVTAVGFLAALLVSTAALPVALLLVGGGLSWAGVLQSRFMDRFPAADRGTGFGLARTVFVFCGAAGNAVTGWLAETAGWPVAQGVLVGLLAVGVLALGVNYVGRIGL